MTMKTYSHLALQRRLPTEYEIVSSKLLYYPERGFSVATPGGKWLVEHQTRARATGVDWEAFVDPARTTYKDYVTRRHQSEIATEALLRAVVERRYDQALDPAWLRVLDEVLPVWRFPMHGMQMAASYLAHAAPSGKLVQTGLFLAADEMRRLQLVARRMRLLMDVDPTFGSGSRAAWSTAPDWQPLRRVIEHVWVTYDWLDAFAAFALGVKPAIDEFLLETLPAAARQRGDYLLGELLYTLKDDATWHVAWTTALRAQIEGASPATARALQVDAAAWRRDTEAALAPLAKRLGELPVTKRT